MKKIILTFVAVLAVSASLLGGYCYSLLTKAYTGPEKVFIVRNGDTFGRVNQRLFDAGIIPDKRLFHYFAKYQGLMTKFRAGSFTIPTGANLMQVLDTLVYGQPNLISITIPEGKNMYEIAKLLDAAGVTREREFLEAVEHPELISKLEIGATSLEGYLYPETYKFAADTPAKSVAKSMIDLFFERTKDLRFEHPFLNRHQVIVLASVVEKETGAKFERPMIAGVFTNRLIKKMRLQSDPTTVYGIWSRYQGNITKADLLELTPYNTYKIPALPAGPISNPSLEAIQAVLSPTRHDYLYFVSKNDGTHVFSRTYEDHDKAVSDFQKNRNARNGKSWRDLKQ